MRTVNTVPGSEHNMKERIPPLCAFSPSLFFSPPEQPHQFRSGSGTSACVVHLYLCNHAQLCWSFCSIVSMKTFHDVQNGRYGR